MFKHGEIIIVSDKPDFMLVHVQHNYGAIKNVGWLVRTQEGNFILVSYRSNYLASVVFLLDHKVIAALTFLVNHPECVDDLSKFASWVQSTQSVAYFTSLFGSG